ncbi:MAG: hypothetical protein ACAH17_01775 [Candidatus Paceibacterota bacterium]
MRTPAISVLLALGSLAAQAQGLAMSREEANAFMVETSGLPDSATVVANAQTAPSRNQAGGHAEIENILPSKSFFQCGRSSISINRWLVSHHMGSDHHRDLNEKNSGWGLVYNCGNWSAGLDRMVNSNRGTAIVGSVFWGKKFIEMGPVFLKGSIGYVRVSYEVPHYNVTLYDNAAIAFVSVGTTYIPGLQLNITKVPKTAGRALLSWMTYEVYVFK